jgi:hypothetical protein
MHPGKIANGAGFAAHRIWFGAVLLLATESFGSIITVTNLADNGAGTLRQAIADAASGDTINFAVTGTITLTNGELLLTNNLNILGPGYKALALSASNLSRLVEIRSNVTVSISDLTFRDGHAPNGTNGTSDSRVGGNGSDGGGIYNAGNLTLTNCAILLNSSGDGGSGYFAPSGQIPDGGQAGAGGGIFNSGALSATRCSFSGNRGGHGGSGGYDSAGSQGAKGGSGGPGGGIYSWGSLTLIGCTFESNSSGSGGLGGLEGNPQGQGGYGGDGGSGGAICTGSVGLTNCTFTSNSTGNGGGGGGGGYYVGSGYGGAGGNGGALFVGSSCLAIACTFCLNSGGVGGQGPHNIIGIGGSGGGIFNVSPGATTMLRNTLVASNSVAVGVSAGTGPDLAGTFTSQGHNLVGQTNGCAGITSGTNADLAGTSSSPLDPVVGVLSANAGPAAALPLLPGSPAIDAGDDALVSAPYSLQTDQRGLPRKSGTHVDIGAFEFQQAVVPFKTVSSIIPASRALRLALSNIPGASFTILCSTNVTTPLSNWPVLGSMSETLPGQYEFTNAAFTNNARRFYRVRSP